MELPAVNPGPAVRFARLDDAEAITRIYNQGIADRIATFEAEPRSTAWTREQLEAKLDHHPAVVIEAEGEVVAFAWTSLYRPRQCYARIAEHSVYVDRRWRRRGLGEIALRSLVAECEARGFHKLVSRIFVENQPSLRLHDRLGFRRVGNIPAACAAGRGVARHRDRGTADRRGGRTLRGRPQRPW